MARTAPPKVLSAVLCDEIRQEINNKLILIGVYTGDIVLSTFPATIPFSMYLEMIPNVTGEYQIEFSYEFDGQKVSDLVASAHTEKGDETAIFPVPRMPVSIPQPGTLSATLSINGRKKFVLSKHVKRAD